MAWPSIDGNNFISAKDDRKRAGAVIKNITPPGQDGHTYRDDGTRGRVYKVQTIRDKSTAASAETLVDTYKALIGTEVTYIDHNQQSHTSQMIVFVDASTPKYAATPVGGVEGGNYLLVANWVLQDNA